MKKCKSLFAILLALSLLLSLPLAVSAEDAALTYVPLTADGTNTANVTVDGSFSTEEWGQPILSKTMAEVRAVDGSSGNWEVWSFDNSKRATQRVEIYVKRNNERLMLAVRLVDAHHLDKGLAVGGSGAYKHANMRFAVATYDYANNANVANFPHGDSVFEYYTGFQIRQRWDEANNTFVKENSVSAPGQPTPAPLKDGDYAIGWDEATSTYTYEVSVTYGQLYDRAAKHKDLMLAVEVTDARVDGKDCGNRWFISGASYKSMDSGDSANKYGFRDGNPMRVTFDDGSYTNTAFNTMPTAAPVLDGAVTTTEWGQPTIVASANFVSNSWDKTYVFFSESAKLDVNKKAKIWLTNDADYIYVAATLDHETFAAAGTKQACLGIMLGAAGKDTDLVQFDYKDVIYDKYYSFQINMSLDGQTATVNPGVAPGVDKPATLQADEFIGKYDATTKTFTYEVRVPYSYTNINPKTSTDVRFAAYFASAHQGIANDQNRYCIGGPGYANYPSQGKTPYQGRCLKMTLNKVQDVAAKLANGETVTLTCSQDLGTTPLSLAVGAKLDLNGYALTANVVRANNAQIVDTTNGQGILKIAKNDVDDDSHLLELAADNPALALYDTNGYRFFSYSTKHLTRTAENQAQFGFALDLPAAAYELLKEPENADITLSAKITSEALSEDITYDFSSQIVSKFAQMKQAEPEENWVIVLKISGVNTLEEGQTLTVAPTFKSSTGITAAPTAQTFTK